MGIIFIDRDGTIGGNDKVTFPKDFKLYSSVKKSMKKLKDNYYKICCITNQPDISIGIMQIHELEKELSNLGFDDMCICPHLPGDNCKCRKPSPYMINKIIDKYNANRKECYIIGDRWSDIASGINANIKTILVLTGNGLQTIEMLSQHNTNIAPDFITLKFSTAIDIILKDKEKSSCDFKISTITIP